MTICSARRRKPKTTISFTRRSVKKRASPTSWTGKRSRTFRSPKSATVSAIPSSPNRPLNLILGVVLAAFLSLGQCLLSRDVERRRAHAAPTGSADRRDGAGHGAGEQPPDAESVDTREVKVDRSSAQLPSCKVRGTKRVQVEDQIVEPAMPALRRREATVTSSTTCSCCSRTCKTDRKSCAKERRSRLRRHRRAMARPTWPSCSRSSWRATPAGARW